MLLTISSSVNAVVQFVTVLIIFLFVLAITYFTTRWIANYQKGRIDSSNIEVLETFKIAVNKYVQIVKLGDKYLAIAVCKDTVTVLTELTKEQLIISEADTVPPSFQELLEKAKNLKLKK